MKNKIRYISSRVLIISIIIFILMIINFSAHLYLCLKLENNFIYTLISGIIMILFPTLFINFIIIPYVKWEKSIKYFIDESTNKVFNENSVIPLSPQSLIEVKKIEEMFYSPQAFELNKRQAQYIALQNQINPHFLYNTLESIRSEAIIGGINSVAEMTEALAAFFRYTISKVENLVSVEEELDNCKVYYKIQQYRFGDRIKLYINYQDDNIEFINKCKIPKLTLQPILENCIIHGTELIIGTGVLRINLECTQKRLIIRVSDNGIGMDEKELQSLNMKIINSSNIQYDSTDEYGGIALANVNNRIRLIFGEEYGIHIYSIKGMGTETDVTLQAVTDERQISNKGILK